MPFDDASPRAPRHDLSTGRGRLGRLLEFFESEVDPEQVRLGNWTCGTHACLGGWACRIPEFQELGLGLRSHSWYPCYRGQVGLDALREFFGLTSGQKPSDLFSYRSGQEGAGSDYEIALARLRRHLGVATSPAAGR